MAPGWVKSETTADVNQSNNSMVLSLLPQGCDLWKYKSQSLLLSAAEFSL